MIKETVNQIAREGLLLEHARQMGIDLSPAEERAMLRLDRHTYNALKNILPKRVPSPDDMEEVRDGILKATTEAFRTSAEELRNEGDWEAFGAVHWVAGAQGIRL